jgi:hypothetical protein
MWMGGTPPLGYRPDGRSLAIVEEHAAVVRDIFGRYLEVGNVRLVADTLAREGAVAPRRETTSGKVYGECAFTRGQLYAILKNPIYVGDIRHQDKLHKGLHTAIIDRGSWDQVQAKLADHLQGERRSAPAARPSLLAGLVVDEAGEPLVATHACKGKVRYRYYVSRALHHGGASDAAAIRMPAREIEAAVTALVAEALNDPLALAAQAWLVVPPGEVPHIMARSAAAASEVGQCERQLVRSLVQTVRLLRGRIQVDVATQALADLLQVPATSDAPARVILSSELRLTRTGRAVRLIQDNGTAIGAARPDLTLVKLLAKARSWWNEVRAGEIDIPALARREGVTDSYVTRIVRLAFLAPSVVEAILAGSQFAAVSGVKLTAPDSIPVEWAEQRAIFQPRMNAHRQPPAGLRKQKPTIGARLGTAGTGPSET